MRASLNVTARLVAAPLHADQCLRREIFADVAIRRRAEIDGILPVVVLVDAAKPLPLNAADLTPLAGPHVRIIGPEDVVETHVARV